ncbi:MAG: XylR family transcriptional regulator [Verrucomicrobiales bacterium]|nr:XylR family transcriptional regulator [Verrucomicrobiales bacterium]
MPTARVALFVETSREYGRGLLRGIIRYQQEHGPWSIYFKPHGLHDPSPSWLAKWNGDGILARIDNRAMADAVLSAKVPAIDLRASLRNLNLPNVGIDNHLVVKLAVEHFLERGHRHFAFYGTPKGEHYYQDLRSSSFVDALSVQGFSCSVFEHSSAALSWEQEQSHLATWLQALLKPVAIMTCHDDRGQQLLDACLRASLRVPDDIAILGVDNDPFLCNLSTPPLSSIDVNSSNIGYQAAAQLDQMMQGKKIHNQLAYLAPRGIVTRQSTDVMAINDPHVVQFMRLIRSHACTGSSIEELLKQVPVSRSALFRRFKKILGRSPKEELTRVRIERAKELLRETSLSVADIADRIGYAESKYFIEVFSRSVKTTPLRYRKTFR